MLKEKNTGDIFVFRMTNGEEIIGKLEVEGDTKYVVKKPATIGLVQNDKGEPILDMQPSVFCMDINKSVEIMKTAVAMLTTPRDDIKNSYIKSTSGIQVAGVNELHGITGS